VSRPRRGATRAGADYVEPSKAIAAVKPSPSGIPARLRSGALTARFDLQRHASGRVLHRFVLPYPHYRPPGRHERAIISPIPGDVASELCLPIPSVRPRLARVIWTAMPVTPIHKYGDSCRGEQDIRSDPPATYLKTVVLAIAEAKRMERSAQLKLGTTFPSAVSLHGASYGGAAGGWNVPNRAKRVHRGPPRFSAPGPKGLDPCQDVPHGRRKGRGSSLGPAGRAPVLDSRPVSAGRAESFDAAIPQVPVDVSDSRPPLRAAEVRRCRADVARRSRVPPPASRPGNIEDAQARVRLAFDSSSGTALSPSPAVPAPSMTDDSLRA
jgi:hypothetical protein